jgi:hypothetical protein
MTILTQALRMVVRSGCLNIPVKTREERGASLPCTSHGKLPAVPATQSGPSHLAVTRHSLTSDVPSALRSFLNTAAPSNRPVQ